MLDDFQGQGEFLPRPADEAAGVATVRPDKADALVRGPPSVQQADGRLTVPVFAAVTATTSSRPRQSGTAPQLTAPEGRNAPTSPSISQ